MSAAPIDANIAKGKFRQVKGTVISCRLYQYSIASETSGRVTIESIFEKIVPPQDFSLYALPA